MTWNDVHQTVIVTGALLWIYWTSRLIRSAVNFLDQWAEPPVINVVHHK